MDTEEPEDNRQEDDQQESRQTCHDILERCLNECCDCLEQCQTKELFKCKSDTCYNDQYQCTWEQDFKGSCDVRWNRIRHADLQLTGVDDLDIQCCRHDCDKHSDEKSLRVCVVGSKYIVDCNCFSGFCSYCCSRSYTKRDKAG